jgi:hypothetical protein
MGLAQPREKATWIKLSAGNGGTGFLQYATKEKDGSGKTIYKDVQDGLENVYFVDCVFKLEEKDGQKRRKLHATFVDAVDGSRFIISAGWSTQLSRTLMYEAYYGDFDPAKPFTVIKTFQGGDPLPNGHKPIVVLLSQRPSPQKGDYMGTLSAHIRDEVIKKTREVPDGNGSSYMTYDWAGILNPIEEPLREKLRAAERARQFATGFDDASDEMPDDDDDYGYSDDTSYLSAPPVIPQSTSAPAPTVSPHQLFGVIPSAPVAAPAPTQVVHGNSLLESATIVAPPGSGEQSETEKLGQLVAQAGWTTATINRFYSLFGATNNLTLITAGKMNEAIAYVQDMIDFYEAAASLDPADYGTIDKPYGDWAIGIFARKELVQVEGLKEAIENVKKLVIPF